MDSDEYKAWHEVGHATVCLHLGGDLDLIEFLEENSQGFAVARGCYVMPETERSVACGGFAAEVFLLQSGLIAGVDLNDQKIVSEVSARVFSNAWQDHQEFIGRTVTEDNDFTKEEKEAFMNYSIERVMPIFRHYAEKMKLVVSELLAARSISGAKVRAILEINIPR
ncbi:M50 family metallopeptidase [Aestuariirhabdus sp. Z084]|uniref:M50 family metallopeptidase n=1 Tax=Aestuariirhabdus haliotis TaxID=2918751 RepID=UPI00201B3733|nr:M50 family metallopeptidase [Aestuariirhabdus haliotis]MCL6417875.1 M50 family metallopeptidase [Aestuariirhabdus haliotis]MCL6421756.1 M50 family metallopeptidase [Aestuariirhabdus haliotis]